jgi:N6-L-threonylcarbamoyladenine synthase
MLSIVAEDHDARFCVVPKEFALDNGAMIAWTGILAYESHITVPIERSFVKLKWRLDEVYASWGEG